MFHRLKLTNFRQHADREFVFEPGLVALRGANEAGKTTILEAIAYAWFGTDALREALAETVTWGAKEASLKVELDFALNGTLYKAVRGKSGAEITFGDERITGQKQTKAFMENLLGTTVAPKLMLANQAALRGALEEGPTATAQLIETLADFDLIDRIIGLITERLPSGNSTAVEQRIAMLSQQVEQSRPEPLDLSESEVQLQALQEAATRIDEELRLATEDYNVNHGPAEEARAQIAQYRRLEAQKQGLQTQIERDTAYLQTLDPVCKVSAAQVEALRRAVAEEVDCDRALRIWNSLQALQVPADVWEGDRASFEAEIADHRAAITQLTQGRNQAYLDHQSALGRKINEKVCAFCKKDLSEVPEVAQLNDELDAVVQAKAAGIRDLDAAIRQHQEVLEILHGLETCERQWAKTFAAAAGYIELIDDRVPANWRWTGPVFAEGDRPDSRPLLAEAEAEVARANRAQGQLEATQRGLQQAQATLVALEAQMVALEPALASTLPSLDLDLKNAVARLQQQRDECAHKVTTAQAEMGYAKSMHAAAEQRHQEQVKALAAAQAELEQLNFHNGLIRKLRAARPKVADELWTIVLSSVSHYFSQIRGVKSAVTRADKGFQVDGRSTQGLSGSTLDALGLAIRIALTKTFLPNSRFMILDEPAAACDDNRESNMLGLMAACDFEQVLLVTHSELADSFAAQVVSL